MAIKVEANALGVPIGLNNNYIEPGGKMTIKYIMINIPLHQTKYNFHLEVQIITQ